MGLAGILGLGVVLSVLLMQRGIALRNQRILHVLNGLWLLLEIIAGYFTVLAFSGRMYSENWEMIGFIFISMPLLALTAIGSIVEIILTARLDKRFRVAKISAVVLLGIAVLLAITGIISG